MKIRITIGMHNIGHSNARKKAPLWHTAYEVIFMAVSHRGAISFEVARMHGKIYGEKTPSIGVIPGFAI